MSRHSKRSRKVTTSPVAARKTENLRDRLSVARRERYYDERRQFDSLPPSILEMSDDFTRDYPQEYSRVDGLPATVRQELPRNVNNLRLQESNLLQSLHSYFQEPSELVSVCQRRSRRRSVLFALHRNKKGSGRGKKHEWTEMSKVRCV